ncbi:MAG: cohesin domain-containing protein [Eubacteriales bacterium]
MKRVIPILLSCLLLLTCFPLPAIGTESDPYFAVESTSGKAGDQVTVAVTVGNNPGIVGFLLSVEYDTDALELVSASEGDFAGITFSESNDSDPFGILWCESLNSDNTTNGTVARLTFRVKEFAPIGDTAVRLNVDSNNVFNSELENVAFETRSGTVTVLQDGPRFSVGAVDSSTNTMTTADNSAFLSTRSGTSEGTFDLRFVLVSEISHIAIGDALEITFLRSDGQTMTIRRVVAEDDSTETGILKLYSQVTAAGVRYQAGENCVIYGVVVSGIPYDAFEQVKISVKRGDEVLASARTTYEIIKTYMLGITE